MTTTLASKACRVCGETKALIAFNRNRKQEDGRDTLCRDCNKARQREYREKNPSKKREWVEANRDHVREQRREKQYHLVNPEKAAAHSKVKHAILMGRLRRPDTCEECGSGGRIEGHHDDYSKPLDVRWLCCRCHRALHSARQQTRLEGSPWQDIDPEEGESNV